MIYTTETSFPIYISTHFVLIGAINTDEIVCINSSGKYGLVGPNYRAGFGIGSDVNNIRVRIVK